MSIYEYWDNDCTYYVRDGQVILTAFFEQDPHDIAAAAFEAAGFPVLVGGDVSDAIRAAYVAAHPEDPEAENLDSDAEWLEQALQEGRVAP
ncbi:hypothetical protein [Deinococcus sp. S9]|uniref:hypothetical protein n=1 Tax=Deinococcus sp. S9 TaxID=2545754 RepID=UPI0010566DF5|nr:hypothetical protein [Deinococcus sp. S9]TDE87406.1 hypothetical protein E0686_02625 [Deinococcus sp. S9]